MKTLKEQLLFPDVSIDKVKLAGKISGKTIVITGASYGIGEQLAILFSYYKVHLVLIARTDLRLKEIAAIVTQNGSECNIIPANLYIEEETDKVVDTLINLPYGIDVFISNAGKSITRSLSLSLNRYHDFTRTNALNYLAPVKLMIGVTPLLETNRGQVINVSSLNVLLLPAPKWAAYQASKTALDQWFRANLAEWRIMGIKAKTIYLPLVRTRMIAPNENYKNYPAMQPQQAALRIAKLLYSPSRYSKPWWAVFPQVGSFFGRYIWEKLSFYYLNKHNEDTI